MPNDTTDTELQKLVDQKLSQTEISRRTGMPLSTLRRRLKALRTPEIRQSVPNTSNAPDELEELRAKYRMYPELLHDMERSYRGVRKMTNHNAEITIYDDGQPTERKTYHVQKRYIAAIERAADRQGVSNSEIVNQAFEAFFHLDPPLYTYLNPHER